jgi:chemotaxis-related protein WspD
MIRTLKWTPDAGLGNGLATPDHGEGCWHRIGVSGDRSCPELSTFVHCRNCPAFTAAARSFFDRPAPEGYLAEWSTWLTDCGAEGQGTSCDRGGGGGDGDEDDAIAQRDGVSILIFRLGGESLAFRTRAVAEVTTPRPVHRVPHRSGRVLAGLVNLQGQAQLCVSLHGLLGIEIPGPSPRLVVLRDRRRGETWAFGADEVTGVQRVPRAHWGAVPSTLANPAVGFSQAVLSWNGRTVGLLDEQRVFAALREIEG